MTDINWLSPKLLNTKKPLGLMSAPGFISRSVSKDIKHLKNEGVSTLVSLTDTSELELYKVHDLKKLLKLQNINHISSPIPNGMAPTKFQAKTLIKKILKLLENDMKVVIHCIGGFGRTGTIAACILVTNGMAPTQAIETVRNIRPNSIETKIQEEFIKSFLSPGS